ncbi:hypothetical protein CVT26_005375 [Gymnopilus dilepis]|uniref:F-box domain-containing protein n=1 Tax=Gymnopilus dilepis TaxID=231916 RepID=A0A409WWS7_9AGAR|nr:hypothetical protein CVT26_005375 [Gymnopilus dilepis]
MRVENVELDENDACFQSLTSFELQADWELFDCHRLFRILRRMPVLEKLVLRTRSCTATFQMSNLFDALENSSTSPRILLPELRFLELHASDWISDGSIDFLSSISMPKLLAFVLLQKNCFQGEESEVVVCYGSSLHQLHHILSLPPVHSSLEVGLASFYRRLLVLEHTKHDDSTLDVVLNALSPDIIQSIESLTLDYSALTQTTGHRLRKFKARPALPSLTCLSIKSASSRQWKYVVMELTGACNEHSSLTSLEISQATDLFPLNTDHPDHIDLARKFPRLRRLKLDNVNSNAFLQHLLENPRPSTAGTFARKAPCLLPDFEVLWISNDPYVSKRLLYRVIKSRHLAGKPLKKLFLDRHFSSNKDSWEYLQECVDLTEVCV